MPIPERPVAPKLTKGAAITSCIRRTFLVAALAALVALATLPAVAGASEPQPRTAPLSAEFIETLNEPPAGGRLGHVPNPVEVRLAPSAKAELKAEARSLSDRYDPRDAVPNRLTSVRNQGRWGTCWAFANMAALESALLPSRTWDFSEDNLITRSGFGPYPAPRDTWLAPKWYPYDFGGWDLQAVAYLVRWAGPVTETDDRYGTPKPPRRNRVRKHVQGVVMLPGRGSTSDNAVLKQLVSDYGAVSVGMYWDDEAYSRYDDPASAHAAYYLPQTNGENHGVAVVGWDDGFSSANFTSSAGEPLHDGAFLVRNSWGSRWGDGGYFWVSYDDPSFAFDSCTAYSQVEGRTNYSRVYDYDSLGWTSSFGYGTDRAWSANRFTGRSKGWLTAAGFYAPASGTAYEVWVGSSFKKLRKRATGTAELPGYTTVKLDRAMRVRTRRQFIVAVRISAPGVTEPVAVERRLRSYLAFATAQRGQSYVRAGDGNGWRDLTRIRGQRNTNVCIKAYTE